MTEKAITKIEPQANVLPADPMVSMIERIAMDPNSDLAKLEKMLDMKERHEAAQAKASFAAAFARASAAFPTIPLNGKGHNGKPYAMLKDIIAGTRPVLSENGLALTFQIDTSGQKIVVTAELMHKDGHSKTTSIDLPADNSGSKNAVQAVGSSQTYGQRYTAQAILGLSLGDDIDDDAKGTPPAEKYPSWAQTIVQDMPPTATARDKAEAIADALCAQFDRMKGEKQLMNEWDRRVDIIEKMQEQHRDLHGKVIDAYEYRMMQITGNDA